MGKLMPMCLCRAGRYGEFENKFLEDSKIYCTWDNLSKSIMKFHIKQELQQYFVYNNSDVKVKTAINGGKLRMAICLRD